MSLEDVNTLEDTAAYLKITREALLTLARTRRIAALKQGRVWTFPRSVIAAYIEANTTPAIGQPSNPFGLTSRSAASIRKLGNPGPHPG